MKLRQVIVLGTGFGIIALGIFLMNYLGSFKEPPKKEDPKENRKYVKTESVLYREVPTEIVAFGRVSTAQSLDLIAEQSGRMFQGSVKLKEGQSFRRGNLLFFVDDAEAKLTLQADKSNFLRDLAAILPDIKIDFPQAFAKWETYFKSIDIGKPLPQLPPYGSDKEKTFLATKNIFSSYYSIKSSEERLRKYRFYAPFDGSISEVDLQSGSFVNPGNRIGKVLRSGLLELKVDVEVEDIGWVQKGSDASVVSEDRKGYWKGVVTRIGEYVNQNTQSIDVFIAMQRGEHPLYDGQYLQATIPGKTVKNGMIIPRNAVFNGNEVFVVEDTLLKVKRVDIHKVNPASVVFSGLEENSDVVVEPLINAHNNMRVFKLEDRDKEIDVEKKQGADRKLVKS